MNTKQKITRTIMYDIVFQLKSLTTKYREGSFATQANRRNMLRLFGTQLHEAGFTKMTAIDLGGRHVNRLIELWREQGISPGTVKNRMSVLRWWAAKIGSQSIMGKDNARYGVPQRAYVATASKAQALPVDKLTRITNAHVRMSLELQRAFGLRREEAIKIRPWQADEGCRLVLQGSWCKGGKSREVLVLSDHQRQVLDRAKALVKTHTSSLIPAHKTYYQQMKTYEGACLRAGLHKMHGLRHAYAQERFAELTGFPCPVAGGPHATELSHAQVVLDADARAIISTELGHEREQITTAYLGR